MTMQAQRLGVLVGVDRSECGQQALGWAVQDAATRGSVLTIAHVVDLPRIADVPLSSELVDAAARAARQMLDAAVGRSHRTHPRLEIGSRLASGSPAAELLRLAADADQLVVGSRGHGGFASLLLGSTAAQLAAHASCPVIVVRGSATAGGPVVVGVDGSDRSEAALDYGFAYATRHGLPLHALHVYPNYPTMVAYPMAPIDMQVVRDGAELFLSQAVTQWSAKHPDVPATHQVAEGTPAHALANTSKNASLLVVGSRGHGGFAGLLLGSVSQAIVRHAHCPVAVAR
jgi:nucleotide-binding universal stress UspA family protein